MLDRKHRDHRVVLAVPPHIVDPLPTAARDPIIVGRTADAEAFFGHAQHKFFSRREIAENFL